MKRKKTTWQMILVFLRALTTLPSRTIYKEGILILPHCFRDVSGGDIGGGRKEKEGGREVNKKAKTRLDPRMGKAER